MTPRARSAGWLTVRPSLLNNPRPQTCLASALIRTLTCGRRDRVLIVQALHIRGDRRDGTASQIFHTIDRRFELLDRQERCARSGVSCSLCVARALDPLGQSHKRTRRHLASATRHATCSAHVPTCRQYTSPTICPRRVRPRAGSLRQRACPHGRFGRTCQIGGVSIGYDEDEERVPARSRSGREHALHVRSTDLHWMPDGRVAESDNGDQT